ncbi:homeodomain transcription factor [Lithospermum erythrorhizon]|uniref:Homeodomain transcription factor n=1 Tax=Lithospermum erythrorhizon TaxID=34254 RepID=A0AAV3PFH4_LITER
MSLFISQGETQDLSTHKAQGPFSSHSVGSYTINNDAGNASLSYTGQAILTMAFQFPIGTNLQENVASMACQYVCSVISCVKRVSLATAPLELSPDLLSNLCPGNPEAHTLAQRIWESYCSQVGGELLRADWSDGDSIMRNMWNHQNAILCFSLELLPRFKFANQAGLNMLETTFVALQDITLDKIMSYTTLKSLNSEFSVILNQGFAYLPGGICVSTTGRQASYDQAIAWKVIAGDDINTHCLAISFGNWSFV